MNKQELITALAERAEMTKKDTEKLITAFQEVVTETLVDGEKISMSGFLTLEPCEVAEKACRNPQNGSRVIVPKHTKVKIKVGKNLKEAVK